MKKLIISLILISFFLFGCTMLNQTALDQNNSNSNADNNTNLTVDNNTQNNSYSNLDAFRKVKNGDNVSVHYILTVDGEEIQSSYAMGEPIDFTVGNGQMISGFDSAVVGMKKGDKKTVTILPKDAYGELSSEVIYISRSLFESGQDINVGMIFYNGSKNITIVSVEDNNIGVTENHPLAGKTLVFDIELVSIN